MKKIGFVGVADATRFTGDVTVAFAEGLETVNGKSLEPVQVGKVVVASGAGRGLVDGDHVIETGGTDG
jgi:hypothetical protein